MKSLKVLVPVVVLVSGSLLWFITCGGGGSGSRVFSGDISIGIGSKGKDVELTAGQAWSRAFSVHYDVSRVGGPFSSLAMNLQDNIPGIGFSPQALAVSRSAGALAVPNGQMWFYVARLEDYQTVCETGEEYGPFEVTVNASSQLSTVDPPSADATQTSMDIINIGRYSFCVKVVSPVDALVDLNRVEFNIQQCDELPADISGSWAGTYSCLSECGSVYDEPIELTVTQDPGDPTRATYEDSEAFYEGTVCGNRFSYSGGGSGYDESGTFVMDPGGTTANKTSTYRDHPPGVCSGQCTDTLARVD